MNPTFKKLNQGWNAHPNAPEPSVRVEGGDLLLAFRPNPFMFPEYQRVAGIELKFHRCMRYRLGPTNDEGWYRGQCRFSKLAPGWGEFYEIEGDLLLNALKTEWTEIAGKNVPGARHYLFYFRDDTFECDAESWSKFEIQP